MAEGRRHFADSLRAMLGAGEPADPRKAARYAWLHRTAAEWQDASRRCTAAWDRFFDAVPDDISDDELDALKLPEPPEEAEVDALWGALDDVIQKDRWPKHLYFGGI